MKYKKCITHMKSEQNKIDSANFTQLATTLRGQNW